MISDGIATEVARRRRDADISRETLADRCQRLGIPMSASMIANIETGRRDATGRRRREVSVDEWLVLAQALEVPPLLLLLPLGRADSVEIRDGHKVSTVDALRWLLGERPLPGTRWEGLDTEDGSPTIASFQVHQRVIERYINLRRNARLIREGALGAQYTAQDAGHQEQEAERAATELRTLRHLMRARDLTPPPLPPELAYLEEASTP